MWVSIVIELDERTAEAFSDALLEAGAASVSVEDAAAGTAHERPIFGEPGAAAGAWPRSLVRALASANADVASLMSRAATGAGLDRTPPWRTEPVPAQDWVRATQSQFVPIRVTQGLWIVPTWHAAPDPAALNIALDPGLAFGTGSHPTTRLCLEWLERQVAGGERVLDYGCGSGILAIAAAKLGAGEVAGVDIDPDAVAAARANAAANGVTIRFHETNEPLSMQADLAVANILASPLKVLAPLLAAHVRTGGRVALAGLLTPQADDVAGAYAPWFDMRAFGDRDGWTGLEGVKR